MHSVSSEMRMQLKPRRTAALFALVFVLLFSTSFAGRQRSFLIDQDSLRQGEGPEAERNEALAQVHARMLNVKTNDYGRYDRPPSMDKPHFKLIPN